VNFTLAKGSLRSVGYSIARFVASVGGVQVPNSHGRQGANPRGHPLKLLTRFQIVGSLVWSWPARRAAWENVGAGLSRVPGGDPPDSPLPLPAFVKSALAKGSLSSVNFTLAKGSLRSVGHSIARFSAPVGGVPVRHSHGRQGETPRDTPP
jgi:hypothetical protein